jgi:hypothetical protein
MMPTMPFGGRLNDSFSIRSRSPKPLVTSSALITVVPSRGPIGIWISSKSSLRVLAASEAISS